MRELAITICSADILSVRSVTFLNVRSVIYFYEIHDIFYADISTRPGALLRRIYKAQDPLHFATL